MKLTDLFTTYWSQVTLILLALGYFIKRILDNKSKKIEINHSLFQQNRINTVNRFFSVSVKVELMFNQIATYEILEHKLNAKDIDKIVFTQLNEMSQVLLELKIYFEKKEHSYFQRLSDSLFSINHKLSELYFDNNPDKNPVTKSSISI